MAYLDFTQNRVLLLALFYQTEAYSLYQPHRLNNEAPAQSPIGQQCRVCPSMNKCQLSLPTEGMITHSIARLQGQPETQTQEQSHLAVLDVLVGCLHASLPFAFQTIYQSGQVYRRRRVFSNRQLVFFVWQGFQKKGRNVFLDLRHSVDPNSSRNQLSCQGACEPYNSSFGRCIIYHTRRAAKCGD